MIIQETFFVKILASIEVCLVFSLSLLCERLRIENESHLIKDTRQEQKTTEVFSVVDHLFSSFEDILALFSLLSKFLH